jgi:CheY-like chemotaxis protein
MKCPKCDSAFTGAPDAEGFFHCPQCGAKLRSRPPGPPPAASEGTPRPDGPPATLDRVLAEIRAVRGAQDEILALLRAKAPPSVEEEGEDQPLPPPIRARRAKSVLVVDDQEETRAAAALALGQAQVPTRTVADGPRALEAIASERPDIIALELAITGSLAGKDLINMIKATMEWIDIPIILWTRLPIESQKEARTIHGADEVVQKGPGAAEVLVARVIQMFRRG